MDISKFDLGDWVYVVPEDKVGMVYETTEDSISVRLGDKNVLYSCNDKIEIKKILRFDAYTKERAVDELLGKKLMYYDGEYNHAEIVHTITYTDFFIVINGMDQNTLMNSFGALVDGRPFGEIVFEEEDK